MKTVVVLVLVLGISVWPIWIGDVFSFYQGTIPENRNAPHFYIPQNIIYSNGDIESLADIMSFGDWNVRSAIFLARDTENTEEARRILMERAGEVFVKADLENPVSEKELGEITAPSVESVFFPYARWKPGSLVYPFVLKKEQFDEWRVRKDPEELLDKKLFYASKRISEIEKWRKEIDLDKAAELYRKKMEEAMKLLKETDWQDERTKQENVLKFQTNLDAHWLKLKGLGFNKEKMGEIKKIFDELKQEIEDLKIDTDESGLLYYFEIPKTGAYQLLIKNEEFNRYLKDNQLKLEAFGEEITVPLLSGNEKWLAGGGFKLEKGKQRLILTKPQATNLLREGDWLNNLAQSSFVKDKLITSAHLQLAFPEKSTVYFKPIENYQGDTSYKISFDYFAYEEEAGITLIQDIEIKQRRLLFSEKLLKTEMDSPRHVEKVFKSTPGAETAEFYFWSKAEGGEDFRIELFNVKIEKVFEPTIILHTTQYQKPAQTPKITFIKINPTKYKVKIERAKEHYTLIFSESFHKGWKAYIDNTPIPKESRKAGILQYSNTPNIYGEIVASYFDGEIKEGEHMNVFLDRNTFETWSKKPIPEDRHLLVNGYANSWYITSEDSGGEENYEIIIEFWPQRLFYIGLGVSLLTLLGCLGYLGYDLAKRKIEKEK